MLDENADLPLGDYPVEQGHDVTSIVRDYARSIQDEDVLSLATHERRILITNDKDFGELVHRGRLPHAGVILFRFPLDATAQQKIAALERLLVTHRTQLDRFLVVTPGGIRVGSPRPEPRE